jgi:hypothetical protein
VRRLWRCVRDLKSKLGLAECVLKDDLVASESKKVASSGRHRLPARIRRNKEPPYVASNHYLEIFKSPVRKAFKKRLDALSDFFFAEVSLPEAIWCNGSVVDALVTAVSAFPAIATKLRTSPEVRFVPIAEKPPPITTARLAGFTN